MDGEEITKEHLYSLSRGSLIEIRTERGDVVGYYDRIDKDRVYTGRVLGKPPHNSIADPRFFKLEDIQKIFLHRLYSP